MSPLLSTFVCKLYANRNIYGTKDINRIRHKEGAA